MGQNILVVNAEGPETRVAVVEEGALAELFVERKHDRGLVGNIYRGKVTRVLPGMQAAFVDLGKGVERAAFLYVGDVLGADDGKKMFDDVETEDGDEAPEAAASRIARSRKHLAQRKIEDLLKPGHEVLVQVVKDPMGLKGARVTGYLSLPGRYSVYMPAVNQVGVSRRISSDKERKRLREVIIDARGGNKGGFILRTAAEGTAEQEIRDDIEYLLRLWKEIGRREDEVKGAGLIYGELDLSLRLVRDLVREETTEVHIDDEDQYNRVRRFTETFLPRYAERMKRFEGRRPIFDHFNIEPALRVAVARRVPLRSGGSLVIDQGEALTAIDVNTGSFTGSNNDLEETVTRNNLEACDEVARQLRLRNIGGIIVVDFIDMDKEGNRKKVWDAFQKALSKDRARCNVTKISELGLVEMTRKRTRESLSQLLTEPCPMCEGAAVVKSTTTVAYEILREVRRSGSSVDAEKVEIECAPKVAEILSARERDYLDGLEKKFQKLVVVLAQKSWKPDQYRVAGKMSTEIAAEEAKQAAALGHAPPPVLGGARGGGGGAGGKRRRRGGRGRSRD